MLATKNYSNKILISRHVFEKFALEMNTPKNFLGTNPNTFSSELTTHILPSAPCSFYSILNHTFPRTWRFITNRRDRCLHAPQNNKIRNRTIKLLCNSRTPRSYLFQHIHNTTFWLVFKNATLLLVERGGIMVDFVVSRG